MVVRCLLCLTRKLHSHLLIRPAQKVCWDACLLTVFVWFQLLFYGKQKEFLMIYHLSTPPGSVAPISPSHTSFSNDQITSTVSTDSTLPPNTSSSSSQPPIALIIGTVVVGLVLMSLTLSVLVLLIKYHRLRFGKRAPHLDNPTYEGESRVQEKRVPGSLGHFEVVHVLPG